MDDGARLFQPKDDLQRYAGYCPAENRSDRVVMRDELLR